MSAELARLPNGVRVALDPMPGLATTAVGVWIRVGARHETAETNGVAHLFEHMAFKGAGGLNAKAFAEAMEGVGAEMNAATSYERTSYYARAVAEEAGFALERIADVVLLPHWDPADLALEKGVVLQEIGKAADQPEDVAFELHQATLYPNQSLGRPILGRAETLAGIGVEDLAAFRDAHMTPDRVVISVAGAFDRAEMLDLSARRFGDLTPRPGPTAAAAMPQAGAAGLTQRAEQAHLALSWPAPAAGAPESYAAWLLAEVFGGGMASRLFQEVREARGLAYAVNAFIDALDDTGRLGVYAGCAAKDADEVVALTLGVLSDLAENGPTPAELARAKAVTRALMLMGAESPLSRAESRAAQAFVHDAVLDYADMTARITATPAEAVQAIAAAALAGPMAGAVVGPKAAAKALTRLRAAG